MSVWNDINQNFTDTSRRWLSWAKQHAQEIGDAGVRHIERQDLLSERRTLLGRVGEEVVHRFLVEGKKTLRADTAEIAEILQRIAAIDIRLEELIQNDQDEADAEKNSRA